MNTIIPARNPEIATGVLIIDVTRKILTATVSPSSLLARASAGAIRTAMVSIPVQEILIAGEVCFVLPKLGVGVILHGASRIVLRRVLLMHIAAVKPLQ
jgi:hypothetical protein